MGEQPLRLHPGAQPPGRVCGHPDGGRHSVGTEKAPRAKVKAAFGHLNTLKIAVMGCVVNGPGEMGDADYGYVGAGNGKVNLYKGRKMVRTAVPEEEAIGALREMIEGRS